MGVEDLELHRFFYPFALPLVFLTCLKLPSWRGPKAHKPAVSCVWWSCVSDLHAEGVSVTSVSPGLMSMRARDLRGEVIKYNRWWGSFPLLPPARLAAQLEELSPHEEGLQSSFPRRKVDLLTQKPIFHPEEAPWADWKATKMLGFSH